MTPAVAISGAPASMYTGASVRLTAHLLRAEGRHLDRERDTGRLAAGRDDHRRAGLYVAPARVPPGGQVTIRATTASGAWEEVTIAIVQAPARAGGAGPARAARDEGAPAPQPVRDPGRG